MLGVKEGAGGQSPPAPFVKRYIYILKIEICAHTFEYRIRLLILTIYKYCVIALIRSNCFLKALHVHYFGVSMEKKKFVPLSQIEELTHIERRYLHERWVKIGYFDSEQNNFVVLIPG